MNRAFAALIYIEKNLGKNTDFHGQMAKKLLL
jgi:hypothetical protein